MILNLPVKPRASPSLARTQAESESDSPGSEPPPAPLTEPGPEAGLAGLGSDSARSGGRRPAPWLAAASPSHGPVPATWTGSPGAGPCTFSLNLSKRVLHTDSEYAGSLRRPGRWRAPGPPAGRPAARGNRRGYRANNSSSGTLGQFDITPPGPGGYITPWLYNTSVTSSITCYKQTGRCYTALLYNHPVALKCT